MVQLRDLLLPFAVEVAPFLWEPRLSRGERSLLLCGGPSEEGLLTDESRPG